MSTRVDRKYAIRHCKHQIWLTQRMIVKLRNARDDYQSNFQWYQNIGNWILEEYGQRYIGDWMTYRNRLINEHQEQMKHIKPVNGCYAISQVPNISFPFYMQNVICLKEIGDKIRQNDEIRKLIKESNEDHHIIDKQLRKVLQRQKEELKIAKRKYLKL